MIFVNDTKNGLCFFLQVLLIYIVLLRDSLLAYHDILINLNNEDYTTPDLRCTSYMTMVCFSYDVFSQGIEYYYVFIRTAMCYNGILILSNLWYVYHRALLYIYMSSIAQLILICYHKMLIYLHILKWLKYNIQYDFNRGYVPLTLIYLETTLSILKYNILRKRWYTMVNAG